MEADLAKLKNDLLSVPSQRLQKISGIRQKRRRGDLAMWEYRYRLTRNVALIRKLEPGFSLSDVEVEGILVRAMGEEDYLLETRSRRKLEELAEAPTAVPTNDNGPLPPPPEIPVVADPLFPELAGDLPSFSDVERPEVAAAGPLIFMNVDVDYSFGRRNRDLCTGVVSDWVPVIRVFGCTRGGNSVCAFVHGFLPYFFCEADGELDIEGLEACLSEDAGYSRVYDEREERIVFCKNGWPKKERFVVRVDTVPARSIYGFSASDRDFYRITLVRPRHVPVARDFMMERGARVYECNVDFVVRFMVDRGIGGFAWIEIPSGKCAAGTDDSTTCQIEVQVGYADLIVHDAADDPRWSDLAPIRILSFDIECKTAKKGTFPDGTRPGDRVIQIANRVTTHGSSDPPYRVVLCYGTAPSPPEVPTLCFPDEPSLMDAWRQFVRVSDPDVITVRSATSRTFAKNSRTGRRPFMKLQTLQQGTTFSRW